jgi:hypothetical protein
MMYLPAWYLIANSGRERPVEYSLLEDETGHINLVSGNGWQKLFGPLLNA